MKIAKKFMTLALVAALSVGCTTVGVSAAGSRTNEITVSVEQSQIYEIIKTIEETEGFEALKEEVPAVAEAFKEVNEGKMDMDGFVDTLKTLAEEAAEDEDLKAAIEEVIEKLEEKDFVTGFTQFKVLDFDKAEKNEDGKYEVEISVPSLTDDMENIQIVVYNKDEEKVWEIVEPISVDKENKTLKVALTDLCYFTIVADALETTEEAE